MSTKMAELQRALGRQQTSAVAAPVQAAAVPAESSTGTATHYKAPSREGKVNITAYLSPDYKRNLRLIQARTGKSLQAIIAESLNDTFQKYDVPTIAGE